MTNEEAIKNITNDACRCCKTYFEKCDEKEDCAYYIAIKALEKQMPKKPSISHFNNVDVAYCPCCENTFGEIAPIECANVHTMKWCYRNGRKESHCEVCGQSIDWSEVEK